MQVAGIMYQLDLVHFQSGYRVNSLSWRQGITILKKRLTIWFMSVPVWLDVHCVHAGTLRDQRASDPLELEWQVVV